MKKVCKKNLIPKNQHGGAALEYVIVTCFSLLLSMAAIAWLSQHFKEKMNSLGKDLGIDASELKIPEF